MNTAERIDYILPAHWACVLINADYTGLSDKDEAQFDEFIDGEFGERDFDSVVMAIPDEEPYFMKYHDAYPYGTLACDCLTYTFIC